jgi:hypothetical protein
MESSLELGMVVWTCDPSIREAETGSSIVNWGQPGLHMEILSQNKKANKKSFQS